jgi:hypothetical protein
MKFLLALIFIPLILNVFTNSATFEAKLQTIAKNKATTRSLLNTLYSTANQNHSETERVRAKSKSKTNTKMRASSLLQRLEMQENLVDHSNSYTIPGVDPSQFRKFMYREYPFIVQKLFELQTAYPTYLRVFEAQKEYGLPYPGGRCQEIQNGAVVETECKHYVAVLTDQSIDNTNKPQV